MNDAIECSIGKLVIHSLGCSVSHMPIIAVASLFFIKSKASSICLYVLRGDVGCSRATAP